MMKNLEKVTSFLLAIGAVLTAASNLYSEYNRSEEVKRKESSTTVCVAS